MNGEAEKFLICQFIIRINCHFTIPSLVCHFTILFFLICIKSYVAFPSICKWKAFFASCLLARVANNLQLQWLVGSIERGQMSYFVWFIVHVSWRRQMKKKNLNEWRSIMMEISSILYAINAVEYCTIDLNFSIINCSTAWQIFTV